MARILPVVILLVAAVFYRSDLRDFYDEHFVSECQKEADRVCLVEMKPKVQVKCGDEPFAEDPQWQACRSRILDLSWDQCHDRAVLACEAGKN